MEQFDDALSAIRNDLISKVRHDLGRSLPPDDLKLLTIPAQVIFNEQMRLHGSMYLARFFPRVRWTASDPVATGSTEAEKNATAHLAELQIAPSITLLNPDAVKAVGPMSSHRMADNGQVRLAPAQASAYDMGYRSLVHRLANKSRALIDNRIIAGDGPAKILATEPGTECVVMPISSADSVSLLSHGREGMKAQFSELDEIVTSYIVPHLQRTIYAGLHAQPFLRKFRLSRNMHVPGEQIRVRASTWHWDSGSPEEGKNVKVLLYLNDVDSQSGCFMALRHNRTRAPVKMDGKKIWGAYAAPASIPNEWMGSLLNEGYRPACLSGPAGTFIAFDTNIVHRGSRPVSGRYRDSFNLEFTLVKYRSKKEHHSKKEEHHSKKEEHQIKRVRVPEAHKYTEIAAALTLKSTDYLNNVSLTPRSPDRPRQRDSERATRPIATATKMPNEVGRSKAKKAASNPPPRVPEAHKYTAIAAALGLKSADDLNEISLAPRSALVNFIEQLKASGKDCTYRSFSAVRELVRKANSCLMDSTRGNISLVIERYGKKLEA